MESDCVCVSSGWLTPDSLPMRGARVHCARRGKVNVLDLAAKMAPTISAASAMKPAQAAKEPQ